MYKKLVEEIRKLEDVLIISDDDLDGICSAKLMEIILSRLNIKHKIVFRKRSQSKTRFLKNIDKKEIIMLDLALKEDFLKKISENKKVIYIDHHHREIPKYLPENTVFFDYKALFNEDICTTCIVYRIGKYMFRDFFKYSLIAFIGMIGDVSYDKIVINDFKKEYKHLLKKDIPTISFYYLFTLLSSLDPEKFVELNFEKDIIDFINEIKIKNIYKKINDFFKKILEFKVIYRDEKLILIETIKPSVLSTFIAPFYENKVIISITPTKKLIFKEKNVKISLRATRDDIDLGTIVKEFTDIYGISGGGHKKAAGAIIRTKDIKKFIDFVRKRL